MKQIIAVSGLQGKENSVREQRQRMKNDYVEEVEFEMGLNSDQLL